VDDPVSGFALLLEELQSNPRGSEGKDGIVLADDCKISSVQTNLKNL